MTENQPPKRKRGGQPGNTNALKHGFHSPRFSIPSSALFKGIAAKTCANQVQLIRELSRIIFTWIEKKQSRYDQDTLTLFSALSLANFSSADCTRAIQLFLDSQPGFTLEEAFREVIVSMQRDSQGG